MRKLMSSMVMLGAVFAAVPAMAQDYQRGNAPGYQDGQGYQNGQAYRGRDNDRDSGRQLLRLREAVDRAIQSRRLSRREADYFRRELGQIETMDQRFRRGGYRSYERRQIDQRADRLFERLRNARDDGPGRDDRRGDRRY